MTIVVGAKFQDGMIVLSDSRATLSFSPSTEGSTHHDEAQKLFPLTKNIVIGFAGNINSFVKIASEIRKKISKDKKLQHVSILGSKLQKILKNEFNKICRSSSHNTDVEIMIAGYSKTQKAQPKMFVFKSRCNFQPIEVSDSFHVIGSGAIVTSYIQEHWDEIQKINTLKSRADWFINNLEIPLSEKQISTVGGLFQVLLVKEDAVYPMTYGQYSTNPYVTEDTYEMKINRGVWTQVNKSTGTTKNLVPPHNISRSQKSSKIKDFKPSDKSRNLEPHINYFVSSAQYQQELGTIDFSPVYNMLASGTYPFEIRLLLNLGFRAPTGKHIIEFYHFKNDDLVGGKISETEWETEDPILDQDVGIEFDFTVREPDVYYFEVHINKFLVARRPILFAAINPELKTKDLNLTYAELANGQHSYMLKLQDQFSDIKLQDGSYKSFTTYFFPCGWAEVSEMNLKFKDIIHVYYPKKFPQKTKMNVFFGFRSCPGKHRLRLDLVNATTRNRVIVNETEVTSSSFLRDTRIEGELIMSFSEAGVYLLEQYVDDSLSADAVILVDDYKNPSFYSLTSDGIESIEKDKGLFLVRNSEQAK